MSKQSEAKERQGYHKNVLVRCCRKCKELKIKIKEKIDWQGRPYNHENLFCGFGGFAVNANGICSCFLPKED
jgi:hypothetical protein